jgi:hypothetical protein
MRPHVTYTAPTADPSVTNDLPDSVIVDGSKSVSCYIIPVVRSFTVSPSEHALTTSQTRLLPVRDRIAHSRDGRSPGLRVCPVGRA